MNTIQETLNALDEVKKAIEDAYASGYSCGKQRTWVGLTDEEIQECYAKAYKIVQGRRLEVALAKAIEAKLKEKNND